MESIADALADLPAPQRAALQRVIDIARNIAPDAVDAVSYAVPALKVTVEPLVGVSASTQHFSVYLFSPAAIDAVRPELDGFSSSKGTVRFPVERQLPESLVVHLVTARLAEMTT